MVRSAFAALAAVFTSINLYAQGLDVDIDIGKPEWYENVYLWVGVVVVLLLILLLTRRRAR